MSTIHNDLVRLGERDQASPPSSSRDGVSREEDVTGLAGQMKRDVIMVALTPTKQEMRSTVGREVSLPFTNLKE